LADNITLNAGSGGAVLATDDVGGVHYQLIKVAYGAADAATPVTTAAPLPVDLRSNNLGGNLNVAVAAAIPAGSNNIGDVDVLSMEPGTGATALGKAEDGAHATGDVGVMGLAVRQDTPGNLSGADGDYEPLQVSGGRLWASAVITSAIPSGNNNIGDVDVATLPALPAGTNNIGDVDVLTLPALPAGDNNIGNVDIVTMPNVTIGTMANLTESLVDDAAFTPATSRVLPIGYEFDDTTPDSVDEGDIGAARMSANRNQYMQIRDLSAERSASVTAANALKVDNSAVTQPVSGTVTANAGTGSFTSAGDVAHDSADSGNPVKVGGVGRTTNPTAVADGDRANLYLDDLGKPVIYPFAPRDRCGHNRIVLSSTTETELVAAGGAGIFRDLVGLILSNESATEVRVDIADGASVGSTTDRVSLDLAADGGGGVIHLPVPLKMGTANHIWTAQLSGAVSSVYVTALYVENN
jgi:hypothetical protein